MIRVEPAEDHAGHADHAVIRVEPAEDHADHALIRVVLAEDHALVRAGLAELIAGAGDITLVGAAADGDEAVRLCAERSPDVVLMDLSMPRTDGVQATRAIVAADPRARVVILTSFNDRDRIIAALEAGATGYLLKDLEPDELFAAVRCAARGESPLAPHAATELLRAPTAPEEALSQREREVLRLVCAGLPNKQIARRLGVSEKTVKAHLTNVFRRIGVADRTQAALWAVEHGVATLSAAAPTER